MPGLLKDEKSFNDAIKQPVVSVVHFQAEWAEQCAQVNEVLDALSKQSEFANVKFYSCPAEEVSEVAFNYKIETVPTVLIFRNNDKLDRIDGADAAKLTETVRKYNNIKPEEAQKALEDRLKSLINKSKVMLFMKGDRDQPRCGFSRTIVQILNDTGVPYETFDILQDEEVRQGLKKYSDWPTYPQLYVKGELLGGLDIVKQMVADNEFTAALNG